MLCWNLSLRTTLSKAPKTINVFTNYYIDRFPSTSKACICWGNGPFDTEIVIPWNPINLRTKAAQREAQQALTGYRYTLGLRNPTTLKRIKDLGLPYALCGKLNQAKNAFDSVLLWGKGLEDADLINGAFLFRRGKLKKQSLYSRSLLLNYQILSFGHQLLCSSALSITSFPNPKWLGICPWR